MGDSKARIFVVYQFSKMDAKVISTMLLTIRNSVYNITNKFIIV
jgi:hypothetical protein